MKKDEELEFIIEVSEKPNGKSVKESKKAQKKAEKEKLEFEKEKARLEKEQAKLEKEQEKIEKKQTKREKEQEKLEKRQAQKEKEQAKLEKEQAKREKEHKKLEKQYAKKEKEQAKIEEQMLIDDEEEEEEIEDTQHDKVVVKVLLIILVLLVVTLFVILFTNESFNIKNIEVKKGNKVSEALVCKYVEDAKGKNIFLYDSAKAEKEIKKAFPYIKQATIYRNFPDTLRVSFEERQAYILIDFNDNYIVMDKYGNILDTIKKEDNDLDVPIVKGVISSEVNPGSVLVGTSDIKYNNIVYLLENMAHVEFGYNIEEIDYEDTTNLKFKLKDKNIDVIYGSIDKDIIVEKLLYLNLLIGKVGDEEGTFDISAEKYQEVIFKKSL